MKNLITCLTLLVSISTFAETEPTKVFVHFRVSGDSTPRFIEQTDELKEALTQTLSNRNFTFTQTESEADLSVNAHASYGGEPFYNGFIRQCEAWITITEVKSGKNRYFESTDRTGIFINPKRCAKRVKKMFSNIPSGEFFGS